MKSNVVNLPVSRSAKSLPAGQCKILPFPKHRSAAAMAADAWKVVLRINNATEQKLFCRRLLALQSAGLGPETIVSDMVEYKSTLNSYVQAARSGSYRRCQA